ncbi:MAG: cytochrome c3 family protein [Verrucomicrobiae bacterium]|nr:cytochrome c3 family protein [Verrucomicrobiae bacterium]
MTNSIGNARLCQSCHITGGAAHGKSLLNIEQAIPDFGIPQDLKAAGTSHRWDSSVSGHMIFAGGASKPSSGTIVPRGSLTTRFPKTFTITITYSGNTGEAFFDWQSTAPFISGGTGVRTGTNVVLSDGISVSFKDGDSSPSFSESDKWYLIVRPGLNMPTNATLLGRMDGEKIKCSTCHNQHSQANPPFESDAPNYAGIGTGSGRHFMAIDNSSGQLCLECHQAYNVTNVSQGSHPVGITIPDTAGFKIPANLPLNSADNKIRCLTCHVTHKSPVADGKLLRLNAADLCNECHTRQTNTNLAHLHAQTGILWTGGQYGSYAPAVTALSIDGKSQKGTCINCHRAHGFPNTSNTSSTYSMLLVENEQNLCITCHDGNPSTPDVRTDFYKTYRHPVTSYTARHSQAEYSDPTRYGVTNRHSECVDCHNPHLVEKDVTPPLKPYVSGKLKGVARVSVTNISTTTVNFTFRPPSDPAPIKEYEICFTCHSSFTTQPVGQSNLALEFNTLNASYHPVEAPGKNTNINQNAFVNGWRGDSIMYCSDCHQSDNPEVKSPHGSQYRYILKKPYTASSSSRTMSNNEICFDCHNYDTYANDQANNTIKAYSRFNPPAYNRGHTYHVGNRRYPCYACHDTHGSANQRFLLITGRNPGMNSYTMTANGGTCAPTCHSSKTYSSLNYAR